MGERGRGGWMRGGGWENGGEGIGERKIETWCLYACVREWVKGNVMGER